LAFFSFSVCLFVNKKILIVENKMVADRTLYDLLGVEPNANQQTITRVYIKLF
jgi:hypothetical protein